MDDTAAISDELVTLVLNCDQSFATTREKFLHKRNLVALDALSVTTIFEESLRLKRLLDQFEAVAPIRASSETADQLLAVLLNCEYLIAWLNAMTPLRENPFLCYWIETLQLWGHQKSDRSSGTTEAEKVWFRSQMIRVAFIQEILQGLDLSSASSKTPTKLRKELGIQDATKFSIEPYVRMLEEEGVYDRRNSTGPQEEEIRVTTSSNGVTNGASSPASPIDAPDSIFDRIAAEPERAGYLLAHLPIDLPSLDLLTKLVQDASLETLSLDSVEVVRDYVQHSLRQLERMVQSRASMDESRDGNSATEETQLGEGQYGRDAQLRAVKLLVLFLRNLITKGLLAPEQLFYELSELCTRYITVPEVRMLAAFVEGGG